MLTNIPYQSLALSVTNTRKSQLNGKRVHFRILRHDELWIHSAFELAQYMHVSIILKFRSYNNHSSSFQLP
ncbi:hypothetical protein EG68_01887 [Paragonimus skrjabini miyazakii]|uniref:Uncharacterized protein n=1 Tax=Paragonimus skrjabini miyazakii TaxID=59628 RepID=A0A8S9Z5V3_9TREM|nr:hypothetical protein EG68_01887 [Paragonimus skrjabini miyazakii]